MTTVRVEVPGAGYDVRVGSGLRHEVGEVVAATTRARRVLVVTQAPIARPWLNDIAGSLEEVGLHVVVAQVDNGEQAKDPGVLAGLWNTCANAGLERRDAIVALGGGVVGDLAGFVAATFNRGMDVVQVPTTLLSMVDASVGGKTGIDLPSGKNLVGAIHQPSAVVSDIDVLDTLPDRVLREGFGEVVKHALIADPELFARLERAGGDVVTDRAGRGDLVARNVAIKAGFVVADSHEHGVRAHLNLGHTYAHALESLTGYATWWHGEAVAVGLLVALALGEELGLHDSDLHARTRHVLRGLGLPVAGPILDRAAVLDVMARDKKSDGGIRYVVLDQLGSPCVVTPTETQIGAALDRIESPDAPSPVARQPGHGPDVDHDLDPDLDPDPELDPGADA